LAQTNVERFERQLEQIQRQTRVVARPEIPAGQRALVDYGGFLAFNFLAADDEQQNTHILREYDLVGYFRLNIDNVHEIFVRGQTGYRDFNSGQSFDGEGDESVSHLDQAYYRFDLARYLGAYRNTATDKNLILQGGRQFVYWANGLVLSDTVDGILTDIDLGPVDVQLLASVTARDTVDFDSSRPDFDHDTLRGFFGGQVSAQLGRHRPFIYALVQRDYNENEQLIVANTVPDTVTSFDYNSYYLGIGANGALSDRLVYGVEFAFEGGTSLSAPQDSAGVPIDQTEEDIQAYALDLRLDYLLADPRRTRLSAETIFASGDDDRGLTNTTYQGNQSGTTDHAFNAWGLLNTGLAFAPAVSNIAMLRVGASTFPVLHTYRFRRLQIGTDLLFFAKLDSDAPIDEPTTGDRFLGFEPDLYLNWQITSDITLALRYGVFFPGSAIVSDEHPRNFFFMGVTLAF
jgi:hypothetical protein